MKIKSSVISIVVLMLAFVTFTIPGNVSAQGVELGDGVAITAEVVAIDRTDRTLALMGPEGNVVAVEVGPEARNFDRIRVGDMAKAVYYESVALYLGKKGQKPEVSEGAVAARSAKGDLPAGAIVEAVDVSARIAAIDRKKMAVTLELPDGRKVTTHVDKSVKAFDTIQVGETIHARYTEAIAISVERQ